MLHLASHRQYTTFDRYSAARLSKVPHGASARHVDRERVPQTMTTLRHCSKVRVYYTKYQGAAVPVLPTNSCGQGFIL